MTTYRTLAIVDDVNTCDCCGKTNLKSTVAMESDAGDLVHFGSVCATRHSGRGAKEIRSEAAAVVEANIKSAKKELAASPEQMAYQARLCAADRAKIRPGKDFADFCRDAARAADAKRNDLAARFGVAVWQI